MTIWQVQLEGDVRDLEYLVKILTTGTRKVLRDETGPGYLYESDSFHPCSTSEEVEHLAEGELAVLSGILKLEREARDGLKYGAVYRANPNGGRDIFVRICESVQARVEMGAVTAVITDAVGNIINQPAPPPPRSVTLLKLSATNAAIAKVLRLLSAPDVSPRQTHLSIDALDREDRVPFKTMVDTFDGNSEAKSAPAASSGGIQAGGD